MSSRAGICVKCGGEFLAMNKQRKYCSVCQIIRDISFRPKLKRDCSICSKTFWPIRGTYTVCADCTLVEDSDTYGPCSRCERHFRPAPGIQSHCISCVSRSAEVRLQYMRLLVKNRDG